ncbi:WhiB family transcription factor [Mycobacterium phage DuncansLeg]|nr:WhiB family transcription factor [Mycobacterium phage DuncansLeg]
MATQGLKWWHEAECQYVGLDIFFPENKGDHGTLGKQICAVCPVVSECLEDAMREERGQGRERRFGVRGNLTAAERWRLAIERGELVSTSKAAAEVLGEAA